MFVFSNTDNQEAEASSEAHDNETNGDEENADNEKGEVVKADSPTHDGRESLKDGYVRERVDEFESRGGKGGDSPKEQSKETSGDPKATIEKFGVTLRPNLPTKLKSSSGHLFVPLEGVLAK